MTVCTGSDLNAWIPSTPDLAMSTRYPADSKTLLRSLNAFCSSSMQRTVAVFLSMEVASTGVTYTTGDRVPHRLLQTCVRFNTVLSVCPVCADFNAQVSERGLWIPALLFPAELP